MGTYRLFSDEKAKLNGINLGFNLCGRLCCSEVEEMLQESNTLFGSNTPDSSIVILITDPKGFPVYVSPNMQDVFGVLCEQALLVDEILLQLSKDGKNELAGRDILIARDKAVVLEAGDGNALIMKADVHEIALAGCHRVITLSKVHESCNIGKLEEKTEFGAENEQGYNKIVDSASMLRHVMDSTVEGIIGVEQDGMFAFINRSGIELLGYDNVDEFLGQNMHKLIHHSKPDGSPLSEEECVHGNARLSGKSIHNSNIVLWRKDGTSFPASCRLQPTFIDGRPAGSVITFLNISEQINTSRENKRLESQLRHYQKMEAIGTLAAGIAHDFNNILGCIIGYGEMMEMFEVEDRAEMLEKVGRILQAAYRAKDLVNQILTFSKKVPGEFAMVDLVPLINETLILLRASFPASITIKTSFTVEHAAIFADSSQIHQVLINLCTNAADSMKKNGGTLVISLGAIEGSDISDTLSGEPLRGSWFQLEVEDTGVGFSSEHAERIFEPYFTTKKVSEGTGMGLALVYGIVSTHNGFISVESQPQVGSVFRLFFPEYTPVKGVFDIESYIPRPVDNGSILFVDDEEALVLVNSELFRKLGYNITATTSSEEAFECFVKTPQSFDLVITDETMPGITGTDLALKIHAVRSDIPVILCMGNSATLSLEKVHDAGIVEILRKPISFDALIGVVEKIVVPRS